MFEDQQPYNTIITYKRDAFREYLTVNKRSCLDTEIEMTPWQLLCFGFKCISAAIWP